LSHLEASPAPSLLSLTASSGFSSSNSEPLSDAEAEEDDEEGANHANAGISLATATTTGSAQAKMFRDYANACDRVRAFYAEQHAKQTVAFNLGAREDFRARPKRRMGVWEAMDLLNKWIDDSDPDVRIPPALPFRPYTTPHTTLYTA